MQRRKRRTKVRCFCIFTGFSLAEKLGKTLVIITHDSRIAKMADRQFSIIDGELTEVAVK